MSYVNGKASFTINKLDPLQDTSNRYGNHAFMQSLARHGDLRMTHQGTDWQYEWRRTAQAILPFLLLGPGTAAQSIDFVRENGITLLVAARSAASARLHARLLDPTRFKSAKGLHTMTLDLDSPYDMITKLPEAIKAINDHVEQSCNSELPTDLYNVGGKVLVYCESGNERSATVVTAYLMVLYGLGAVEAMQIVQSQRFCIAIDDGLKNMLQTFEDILQANRDVARLSQQGQHLEPTVVDTEMLSRVRKRSHEIANESDEEMEDQIEDGDIGIEGRRTGQAPFQDAGS